MIPLVETVKPYINHYGYWAVLIGVFFESFGLPLPGETLIIVAGLVAAKGMLSLTWIIVVAVLATFVANSVSYTTGYFGGHNLMIKYGKYVFMDERKILGLENFVKRHGSKVVIIARFIIGMRQFNGFICGAAKMPWAKFAVFNLIGAVLWVVWWTCLSYYFGKKFDSVFLKYYFIFGIIALAALIFVVFRFSKNIDKDVTLQKPAAS